jgi:hypothetical protein
VRIEVRNEVKNENTGTSQHWEGEGTWIWEVLCFDPGLCINPVISIQSEYRVLPAMIAIIGIKEMRGYVEDLWHL